MVNGRAAEIGGIAPFAKGARALDPVAVKGGATVGVYAIGRSHGAEAGVGRSLPARARARRDPHRRHRGRRRERPPAARPPEARPPGRAGRHGEEAVHRRSPGHRAGRRLRCDDADVDADGRVTRQDLNEAIYGWAAADTLGRHQPRRPRRRRRPAGHRGSHDRRSSRSRRRPARRRSPSWSTRRPTPIDATPGDAICLTAGGVCTLRAAIDEANRHAGPDTVAFNIPGGAPQTIQLTLGKLVINQAGTTIDGFTEPGAHPNTDPIVDNALPGIEIRGNGDGARKSIYITNSDTVIQGLAAGPPVEDHLDVPGREQQHHRRQLHRHRRPGPEHRLLGRRGRAHGRRRERQPDRPAHARRPQRDRQRDRGHRPLQHRHRLATSTATTSSACRPTARRPGASATTASTTTSARRTTSSAASARSTAT